jgi:hypothetical protein
MRSYVALVSFASAAFAAGIVQAAANPEAARNTAIMVCAGCHGPKGISPDNMQHPNLAGQKEAYLASSLRAYRDKTPQFPRHERRRGLPQRRGNCQSRGLFCAAQAVRVNRLSILGLELTLSVAYV